MSFLGTVDPKPTTLNFDPSRSAPEWGWFWALDWYAMLPFGEGGGVPKSIEPRQVAKAAILGAVGWKQGVHGTGPYFDPTQEANEGIELTGFTHMIDATVGVTLIEIIDFLGTATDNALIFTDSWNAFQHRITSLARTVELLPNGRLNLVTSETVVDGLNVIVATMKNDRHSITLNGILAEDTTAGNWTYANKPAYWLLGQMGTWFTRANYIAQFVGVVNGILTREQIAQLTVDPFGPFREVEDFSGWRVPVSGGPSASPWFFQQILARRRAA